MAVGDVDVEVAVVVDVVHLRAEPEREEARTESDLLRDVLEQASPAVLVQRVQLFREVRDEELRPAVSGHVSAVHAHPGLRLSVRVEPDAGGVRHILEGAVSVVSIEEVPHEIVGYIDIRVPIAIHVAEHDAETLAGRVCDTRA